MSLPPAERRAGERRTSNRGPILFERREGDRRQTRQQATFWYLHHAQALK